MTREHMNAIGLIAFGLLFLVTNKPFGELCRQWQILMGRDYGILSFRVPIIIIGALLLLDRYRILILLRTNQSSRTPLL
jgi:hypothetical protein